MNTISLLLIPAAIQLASLSHAQSPIESPAIEPLVEPTSPTTSTSTDPANSDSILRAPHPATPAAVTPSPTDLSTLQRNQLESSDEGYLIKDAPINDVFQFLAKSAGRQYFHNAKIAGPDFRVTGHLNDGNPLTQMEELAFMYGLALHTKGATIYALTQAQLAQLPSVEFHYPLQYLRPTDIKQIEELIKPMLSPATGIVQFEPKTNTIIIIDAAHRIEQARGLLRAIDRAKGQIIVETKILRINSTVAERSGINWTSSLGKDGTALTISADLNSVFGLPSSLASNTPDANGTNLVLSPVQVRGVLRALAEAGLASQVSNPTLITEDNEMATISVIDRVPIITTTTTATSGGAAANPTITEQVRYKVDISDKSIDTDPDKHREIGISLVVTPTLLPDGTVRMKLRPRSAQIIDNIKSVTGNFYPRVTESMIETLARVPNGYSLVVGGFYGETKTTNKTKVPVLGDIPVINFFFKSKEAIKEKTSLVFIVTPKSYDPTNRSGNADASKFVRRSNSIDHEYNWADDTTPNPSAEPNLRRAIRGLKPQAAPYFPSSAEDSCAPPAPLPSLPPAVRPALPKARGK